MLKREKSTHTLLKNKAASVIDTPFSIGSNNNLKQEKIITSAIAGVLSFSFCDNLLHQHVVEAMGGVL
ncbi:hypothetical protein [Mucilaginibacter sp. SP1R1]|uniref:hypothetical protein n=1 Tax=Mucilaginibacter sp. SP1R1 TaxID=2723091 RepID=UPI00161F90E6|nr:hypothetical protein [Mucilaginibacter sp. SP1R1]MBB6149988.1 hypothetical protein [Mucilaginibacter sp. SP1R1]